MINHLALLSYTQGRNRNTVYAIRKKNHKNHHHKNKKICPRERMDYNMLYIKKFKLTRFSHNPKIYILCRIELSYILSTSHIKILCKEKVLCKSAIKKI
jgi:hypothetical protein